MRSLMQNYIDTNKCLMNSLPNELLLYIFSFLEYYELCISVAPVCTAWKDLAKDPYLRKHFAFRRQLSISETEGIKRLLKGSPLLVSLELKMCNDCGDLLHQVASTCTNLRELTLIDCEGITESIWISLMKNCPNIRRLDVIGLNLNRKQVHAIARLHKLRHLELDYEPKFLKAGVLAPIARQCKQLEYLMANDIRIDDDELICLTKNLSHCLKTLSISGRNLTDAAYHSLRALTKLEKLQVISCKRMTDVGLSGISGLRNLISLELRNCQQLTPKGLRSLFIDSSLPLLDELVLRLCPFLDDSVMSAILRNCPRLRYLIMTGLEQLTGAALINLPSALPNLKLLMCSPIDDWIVKRIKTQMPSLQLLITSW